MQNNQNPNRSKPIGEIIPRLSSSIKKSAYIVGAWLWVEFDSKPGKEIIEELREFGFRWNHSRRVWQHTGGVFRPKSPGDPRWKYGRRELEELETKAA